MIDYIQPEPSVDRRNVRRVRGRLPEKRISLVTAAIGMILAVVVLAESRMTPEQQIERFEVLSRAYP